MLIRTKSLKMAGIVAYLYIIVNTVSGFILGPAILLKVGSNIYGIYTTINALVSALMIADLGVSQTLIRFIANYKATNTSVRDIGKLCKTIKAINYIFVFFSVIAGMIVYCIIPYLYKQSFSAQEIHVAQELLLISMVSIISILLSNYYSGIIAGYGYFTYINLSKTISVLLKLVLSVLYVTIYANVYMVVWINSIVSILVLVIDYIYFKTFINIKLNYGFAEITILKTLIVYTLYILIQTIVDQVNSNLDNIIIGAMVGASAVTIYSFGLTIFHMFQQLSTSISQMLIPYMSDIVAKRAKPIEIENSLIKIGRIQYIIVGGIYFGFISFGKLFIHLWLGEGFEPVWIIAVILMSGGVFPLVQNGAIALLKAKNMMGFRTASLFVSAIFNAMMTMIFVNRFGYIFAALGTALGFILVNTIIMDIYYYRYLKLNMARVLWNIIKVATCCGVVCALFSYSSQLIFSDCNIFIRFIISVSVFVLLYGISVTYIIFSKEERKVLFGKFIKR